MKTLLLTTLIAIAFAKNIPSHNDQILSMITKHGYQAEISSLTTEDGYILQMVRIPQSQQDTKEKNRPAVLLMHGCMSSAEDFVYGGPSQGLAFYLADKGYDVFMGNSRGSAYGQEHTILDPFKDKAFWRYSFHEIGTKDLPAIVDKVRMISGQDKIDFVGHREGATAFYVMMAEKPEYNEKVKRMVSLGAVTHLKWSTHPWLKAIVENSKSEGWIIKHLGASVFRPSSEFISDLQTECLNSQKEDKICQNVFFLMHGFNSDQLNKTTINQVLQRVQSGGSVREILHLAQMKESGRFESFGRTDSHQYDLSKVSVPVAVFYTPKDPLSQPKDVETLITKLPNVFRQKQKNNYDNNLDFVYANNVAEINENVVNVLQVQINNAFVN